MDIWVHCWTVGVKKKKEKKKEKRAVNQGITYEKKGEKEKETVGYTRNKDQSRTDGALLTPPETKLFFVKKKKRKEKRRINHPPHMI